MSDTPWFIAVRPFGPSDGESWSSFVAWSGLSQLEEIVSLDGMLCEHVLDVAAFDAEDWKHNVDQDFVGALCLDLEYLRRRVSSLGELNLLAAIRSPTPECEQAFRDPRFRFQGYDLYEPDCGPSALTNCGGFPLAFRNAELNRVGLLPTWSRAMEVQAALRETYPDCEHGPWDVWALWRMEPRFVRA
ncbi:MAG: hypothetical protein JNM84_07080 [Planctomycetes bacterium]|nr:hypothetical protein [Planctomycetota bacterium]